jgi:hypothetical protein
VLWRIPRNEGLSPQRRSEPAIRLMGALGPHAVVDGVRARLLWPPMVLGTVRHGVDA